MKKNIGLTDKIIRVAAAIFVAILYFIGTISGTIAIILGIFALIMILTSFVSFCPLYFPFGINTRKKK
ncbi:YgaP family membrane protein [Flavobacterium luteum]|uniref:DUF2892 domain-containing protein n=1 Tax=Flavobacterium luteum TaxID=2026654 RepID=A0A7J5AKV6_9FLAO|nr:DUF2892 domain-containing protein [Flavobacterium luteum]KAB1158185.1 DUF2892 domain-containing protein [Flavobacterium luteum]